MKRILVTGSSGQLGREIVKQLKEKNYAVLGIDVVAAATTDELVDIHNAEKIKALTIGFDAIIHTAAIHGKHYELKYPREAFIKTNIDGTFNLLNACVLNGIREFVRNNLPILAILFPLLFVDLFLNNSLFLE